jgi:endonuclease YncB( thermonuclease family)
MLGRAGQLREWKERVRALLSRGRALLVSLRQPALILGAAFILFFAAFLVLPRLHQRFAAPEPVPVMREAAIKPPETAPPEAVTPFSPQSFGARAGFRQSLEIAPPFDIVDGRSVRHGARIIALAGIAAPAAPAVCRDDDGRLWACGLQARAALNNRIRDGAIACRQAAGGADWTCDAGGEDLALWLVSRGWARPDAGGGMALHRAVEEARQAKLGLWNGGWMIIRSLAPAAESGDGATPDPASAPAR